MNPTMSICDRCNRSYLADKLDRHDYLWHNPEIDGRRRTPDHSEYGIADD